MNNSMENWNEYKKKSTLYQFKGEIQSNSVLLSELKEASGSNLTTRSLSSILNNHTKFSCFVQLSQLTIHLHFQYFRFPGGSEACFFSGIMFRTTFETK